MRKAWSSLCRQDRRGGSDAAQQQQESDSRRANLERLLAGADRDSMSWDSEVRSFGFPSRCRAHHMRCQGAGMARGAVAGQVHVE